MERLQHGCAPELILLTDDYPKLCWALARELRTANVRQELATRSPYWSAARGVGSTARPASNRSSRDRGV